MRQMQTITERTFSLLSYIQIFLLLTLITGAGMLSCAFNNPPFRHTSGKLYQSKDYIVYQPATPMTSAQLAQEFLGDIKQSWLIEESNQGFEFNEGESVVIPLNNINKAGLHIDGFQTVPILAYHRFETNCRSPLCQRVTAFENQMKYLKENGYHVISSMELLSFLEYRRGLPKKSVLITMDDGYRSVYTYAYPILKKYGFTATLFIYTGYVGVSNMALTWDQLKEMKADGFCIGSHTVHHSDLTMPKEGETETEWVDRINKEISGSKKILDKKLGQDTFLLAYPYGKYDQRSIKIADKSGYKIAMSVQRGGNPFFAHPLYLRRDQILRKDMQTFISRLNTFKPMSLK
jgi:peptidoglycan/xylan/chitin deacetylase (PgdA/CDA1 family)